ncbi:unnamed protein product, partial [Ectocarpus sp. 12 AP-2014]
QGSHPQRQQQPPQRKSKKSASPGEYCQVKHCGERPSYSDDGYEPAVRCRDHRKDGMLRVQHDRKTCGADGCTEEADVHYMGRDGRIHRFCARHKEPVVVLEQAVQCEHGECNGTPQYGGHDGPLTFCRAHKRAGMYTTRDGVLYVATRDGIAFRKDHGPPRATANGDREGVTATADAAASTTNGPETASPATPSRGPKTDAKQAAAPTVLPPSPAVEEVNTPPPGSKKRQTLHRKLCEVPGCNVQPSFGAPGTGKPRFCTGHKEEGHVSLKNRPCTFPGCNTRPHYGPSMGRPVFCATHKKKSHVHLLKEAESLGKLQELDTQRRQRRRKLLKSTCKKERSADAKRPNKKAKHETTGDVSTEVEGKGQETKKNKYKSEKGKGPARGKGSVVDGKGPTSSGGKRAAEGAAAAAAAAVAETTASAAKKNKKTGRKGSAENLTRLPSSPRSALPSTTPPTVSATTASGNRLHLRTAPPVLVLPDGAAGVPQREGEDESPRAADGGGGSGGRRARAPSRKLLEASGRVAAEGAQLLTKAKKEEENRLKREMKEQRRAAKSAGLKLGEVIEATAAPLSEEESGSGGGGGGGGGSRGSDGGDDAFSAGEGSPSWRKLSPSDMLRAAQQQQQEEQPAEAEAKQRSLSTKDSGAKSGAVPTKGDCGEPTKGDGGEPTGTPSQRRGKTSSSSGRADNGKSSKRLRLSNGSGVAGGSRGGKGHDSAGKRRSPRGHEGEGEKGGKTGGGTVNGKVLCEIDTCYRPASYGIGDTARLCNIHKTPAAKGSSKPLPI